TRPVLAAAPSQTAFTYQGQLKQNGQPFTGTANVVFSLYDAVAGGTMLGSEGPIAISASNGLFTVVLNDAGQFGPLAFNGARRWLELSVRGTTLPPRQEIPAAPYAQFAYACNSTGGGFTLPYSGSADAGALPSLFSITNTSTTGAAHGISSSTSSPGGAGV